MSVQASSLSCVFTIARAPADDVYSPCRNEVPPTLPRFLPIHASYLFKTDVTTRSKVEYDFSATVTKVDRLTRRGVPGGPFGRVCRMIAVSDGMSVRLYDVADWNQKRPKE